LRQAPASTDQERVRLDTLGLASALRASASCESVERALGRCLDCLQVGRARGRAEKVKKVSVQVAFKTYFDGS
jgi:hypothetical protein